MTGLEDIVDLAERSYFLAEWNLECESRMITLINRLAADYGIDESPHTVRFSRTSDGGNAGAEYAKSWNMFFGINGIRSDFHDGWNEYTRLTPLLEKHGLKNARGWAAIDIFVLHEFAHVLTYYYERCAFESRNSRWYRTIKAHGPEYRAIYAELLELYTPEVV